MRKQEKEIMQETMPGARRRGRPHTTWMDNIRYVDRTPRGRVNQNDRGQKQIEKVRPWCGQSSDRERTEQNNFRTAGRKLTINYILLIPAVYRSINKMHV